MTLKEVNEMIKSIGIDYTYYQFPKDTEHEPPYICFFYTNSNDVYADQSNYQKIRGLSIELYTAQKDFDLEDLVEEVLSSYDLTYYKEESYIDSELMWQISYDMDIVIKEDTNEQ